LGQKALDQKTWLVYSQTRLLRRYPRPDAAASPKAA